MKIVLILLSCLWFSGCATFGQMQRGLNALRGQDVQTAFDILGYPSGKQEFGSDTVYSWQVDSSGAILLPQTSTISGSVGMTPVYGSTTYKPIWRFSTTPCFCCNYDILQVVRADFVSQYFVRFSKV